MVKTPNKTTQKAMHDAEVGKTKKAKSVDALFKRLLITKIKINFYNIQKCFTSPA